MRISDIFGQGNSYDYGNCGRGCDNDFRGRGDPNYFTGIQDTRNNNYRRYDDETDFLALFG